MQHLLDHARSFPNQSGTVLAHRAHADEFLPL